MTVPAWPGTLPQSFLFGTLSEEGADNLIASQVSVGPAKIRRRSTSGAYPLTGAMFMSVAQFATFKTFVKSTTSDRSKAFTFPDPDGGADLLVRMTAPHKRQAMGAGWRIEIELEVLP